MNAMQLQTSIADLLLSKLHLYVPSTSTDLIESGMMDSLTFVDLLTHLEREFDITIHPDDLETDSFRSIDKIVEFVNTRRMAWQPDARL
jgi:methoxymalonate biosynthesis acyl carrier protein